MALLKHLEAVGFEGAPRPVGDGFDVDGREVITYIPGTTPHPGSTIWEYVGGSHTAGAALTQGTVQLGAGSGTWPLTVGSWTAYFLVDDGYTPIGSIEFDVR